MPAVLPAGSVSILIKAFNKASIRTTSFLRYSS